MLSRLLSLNISFRLHIGGLGSRSPASELRGRGRRRYSLGDAEPGPASGISVTLRRFRAPWAPLASERLTLQTQTGNCPAGPGLARNPPFSLLGTVVFGLPRVSALPAAASGSQCLGSTLLWFEFFSLWPQVWSFLIFLHSMSQSYRCCYLENQEPSWREITVIPGMLTYAYNPSTFPPEAEEELC